WVRGSLLWVAVAVSWVVLVLLVEVVVWLSAKVVPLIDRRWPLLSMPPPCAVLVLLKERVAWLPDTVQLTSDSEPLLKMPPPLALAPEAEAVLLEMTSPSSARLPSLSMAPPVLEGDRPLVMVSPEMVALTPALMRKTCRVL